MSDHNVVVSATAYASVAAARRDVEAVGRARDRGDRGHLAAAVLHKGFDGAVTIDPGDMIEPDAAWGGALLAAALTVLVAPVGMALLPPVVATTGWTSVTTLIAQLWQQIAQETLHRMSETVESHPAALVIVTVDVTAPDIRGLLAEAGATIVADGATLGPDAAFMEATDDTR
jgi:hypothetical protein